MPSSEYYYDPDPPDFDEPREPREVVCMFCGKRELHWHPLLVKLLVDQRGVRHDCRGPASADEFDVVAE